MGSADVVRIEDLAGLTDDQVLALLDSTWPWPLSLVQSWFEDLWNHILEWIHSVVDWVWERLRPAFEAVWGWISSAIGTVYTWITSEVSKVWGWIASEVGKVAGWITAGIVRVFDWIASGFAQVSVWIAAEVAKVWSWITTAVGYLWNNVSTWFSNLWSDISAWFSTLWANIWAFLKDLWNAVADIAVAVAEKVGEVVGWFSNEFIDPFLDWLIQLPGKLWEGFLVVMRGIGNALLTWWKGVIVPVFSWLGNMLGKVGGWLMSLVGNALSTVVGWGLDVYGFILGLVSKFVTPVFMRIFDFFEALGPVSPGSGRTTAQSVTSLLTVTMAGLGAMTLAGELLHPLKQLGLGNLAAILYDVTNYKLLTAAFVGVLAGIYIKTPLEYYYNKIARPNIPSEGTLQKLVQEYVITDEEFAENMAFQGFPDSWIPRLRDLASTALAPRMLNYLAVAGITDEALLDRELHHAGYDSRTIPYVKMWLDRSASADAKAMSTTTAMSRYREGFDNEAALKQNLLALGVAPALLPKYAFVADLMFGYDYTHDLVAYYIDAYHRRDIEEPELRSSLITAGLLPERLDLVVAAQSIKRLAAPKPAADPAIDIRFDTIRTKRTKQLTSRQQEVEELVGLGKELDYATAIADQDDVKLATAPPTAPAPPPAYYETDEGKLRVDTIRRMRRQRAIDDTDELAALADIQVPAGLAQAIVDNDSLRLSKQAAG